LVVKFVRAAQQRFDDVDTAREHGGVLM